MIYLETFLYSRCAVLWRNRHMPSVSIILSVESSALMCCQYLGPSMLQLSHLFVLTVLNSLVLFGLILLLGRTVWSLTLNMTTIESWEIERHEAVLRRARVLGGYVDGPDGTRVRVEHQEFPWDASFWFNLCQGMGTSNPLAWIWPFAPSPSVESGLVFEHNGIDGMHHFSSRKSQAADTRRPEQTMAATRSGSHDARGPKACEWYWFHAANGCRLVPCTPSSGSCALRRR